MNKRGKRGVAIVIVLGLIAVLMMMAVAFSIYMRIERTGAANYRYGVQARHMVYAGLANAISDIDGLMKDSAGKALIFPEWDVAVSTQGASRASVLNQTSAQYIPELLREVARKKDAKWNLITDNKGVQRGRYAFVIVNSSGLLDANRAGGFVPRLGGASSEEIVLHNDLGVTDHTQFLTRATNDVRYETFPEFANKNPYYDETNYNSFSMFSLAPIKDQYDIDGAISNRVYIGSDTSKWNEAAIIAAFADSGVPNPTLAYKNLVDYTDSNSVPTDLAAGCVEKVPMINDFSLRYIIDFQADGVIKAKALFMTEWAYPFVQPSDNAYSLTYTILVAAKPGNTIPECVPMSLANTFTTNIGNGFIPQTYGSVDIIWTNAPASSTNANIDVNFDFTVSAYITELSGKAVDSVPYPFNSNNGLVMNINTNNLGRGTKVTVTNCWECRDPRFNWSTTGAPKQWYAYNQLKNVPGWGLSYRQTNFITTAYFGTNVLAGSYDLDNDTAMSVSDSPLETLGELGYLCYDWWRTIRLYEHKVVPSSYPEPKKYHTVLDKFTIWDADYRRGLVNVNTTNNDVLASVFYRMPEEEYSASSTTTIWANAKLIAEQIIQNGPYTNLSELGKVQIDWDALTTGSTEICRESGIRNSVGMLTARDNFFTIIIRADSFSAGVGGKVDKGMSLATSRAVAEVWRDPIPDKVSGQHRCFIRSFRFVED